MIAIGPIATVSPSLVGVLRACKLKAALSRAPAAEDFTLGNPKAWLGRAYHAVLAAASRCNASNVAAVTEAKWKDEVEREFKRSQTHPLDRRFGSPPTWPGYNLIAAMAVVRAREVARPDSPQPRQQVSQAATRSSTATERRLSAAGGRIVGRPDLVRRDEIIDYKTGSVLEDGESNTVKKDFVRQLRLYAYLVHEDTGVWLSRGVLVPMTGASESVDLRPEECVCEATDALQLLDELNGSIAAGVDPKHLAAPSSQTCRWCPYQGICPAFWDTIDATWDDLATVAIEGTVSALPANILGGAAVALSIQIQRGNEAARLVSLGPLALSVHASLSTATVGETIRVTGLWKRADERLCVSQRTVAFPRSQIPVIVTNTANQKRRG